VNAFEFRLSSLVLRLLGWVFDRLPAGTRFYPGPGNDSGLGNERRHLDEWRERGW